MQKKILLFDLDGTLTDSAPGIIHSVSYALRCFGIDSDAGELRKFIGPPLSWSFEEFYGFSHHDAILAVAKYREYFADKGIFENAVYPGIENMLRQFQSAGKRLFVATSKPEVFARRILDHFSLTSYFEGVTGSELDGTRTDKSEVIACALGQAQIGKKAEAVMIGDRKHDVFGAKENGISCIGVLYGYGSREELKEAGATLFAHTPEELTGLLL